MGNRNTLYSYLVELRYRIFYSFFSFFITFIVSYFHSFDFIYLIVQPFFAPKFFIFTDLTEALSSTMYVCFLITFHFVLPFLFYQNWAFNIPGFYIQERNRIIKIIIIFFFLFLLEEFLIFHVCLPEIYNFLLSFEIKKEILTIQLEARILSFISFTFKVYFYLISLFQVPLFFIFSFYFNLVTINTLISCRYYFYFFSLVIAAIISPPDMVYQIILASFLNFFYEIGIWFGLIYEKIYILKKEKNKILSKKGSESL